MHDIEPYWNWRDYYVAEEDSKSPFYKKQYSEFSFENTCYNYFIHPQWDEFGSPTLYLKILFVDYEKGFCILEFIGEWNDAISNDIMFLKTEIINTLTKFGIRKFILIGENVLNFHASDDCYYEEWLDDIKEDDGWIALVNFRKHVEDEMKRVRINNYVFLGERFQDINWRQVKPMHMHKVIEELFLKRINQSSQ